MAETLANGGYVTAFDANGAEKALGLNSEQYLWRDWSDARTAHHVRACAEHVALTTRFASFAAHGFDTSPTPQGDEEKKSVPRQPLSPPWSLSRRQGRPGASSCGFSSLAN